MHFSEIRPQPLRGRHLRRLSVTSTRAASALSRRTSGLTFLAFRLCVTRLAQPAGAWLGSRWLIVAAGLSERWMMGGRTVPYREPGLRLGSVLPSASHILRTLSTTISPSCQTFWECSVPCDPLQKRTIQARLTHAQTNVLLETRMQYKSAKTSPGDHTASASRHRPSTPQGSVWSRTTVAKAARAAQLPSPLAK